MSAHPSTAMSHRRRLLQALGVVPYALRGHAEDQVQADATAGHTPVGPSDCVLVLPAECGARPSRLIEQAMRALGEGFAGAPSVRVVDGGIGAPVPQAQAYLAFGEAQARALGRTLSRDVMVAAQVVLLDPPQAMLAADGKRRLWQAVVGLRRHWRTPGETVG